MTQEKVTRDYDYYCISPQNENMAVVDHVSMCPDKETDAEETKGTVTPKKSDTRSCFLNCKDWCCCKKGKM